MNDARANKRGYPECPEGADAASWMSLVRRLRQVAAGNDWRVGAFKEKSAAHVLKALEAFDGRDAEKAESDRLVDHLKGQLARAKDELDKAHAALNPAKAGPPEQTIESLSSLFRAEIAEGHSPLQVVHRLDALAARFIEMSLKSADSGPIREEFTDHEGRVVMVEHTNETVKITVLDDEIGPGDVIDPYIEDAPRLAAMIRSVHDRAMARKDAS